MRHFVLAVLAVAGFAETAWAQAPAIPEKIGFQGRLTNASGNPADSPANLTFKLYTETGTEKWSSGIQSVTLNGGLYSIALGDSSLSSLPFDEPYYLGITAGSDAEMTPRYPLLAVPYAMRSKKANEADTLDGQHVGAFWKLGGNAVGATGVLGATDNQPMELVVNGARALRLEPNTTSPNVIGGYSGNSVTTDVKGAAIGGGGEATHSNKVTDDYGTVAGGYQNQAGNSAGTTSDRSYGTVGGGSNNAAAGDFSFAVGRNARIAAAHDGAVLFADQSNFNFNSSAANEFAARATGGARFVTGCDASGNPTAGVHVAAGGGSWSSISDRNAKMNFRPVDGEEVLAKVSAMPVTYWQYTWQPDDAVPLIGPVAQDLVGAFYPGEDDKHISTQQADGVHFAAIKALEQRTRELREENALLKAEIENQKARLAALERAVGK